MTLPELLAVLDAMASEPSEETVGLSELDHALQCAHELVLTHPDDAELQVAGLVHDVGHRFGSDELHGVLGAEHVVGLFGARLAALVELHVPAKRYLVTTDASYRSRLSVQSTRTLALQGGALGPDELSSFSASPYAPDAVELRRADDAAKVPGRSVPPLVHWTPLLRALAVHEPT
ncbi:MAG TPA: HD domain-containing protein [Acidimicrobiales bacterium]